MFYFLVLLLVRFCIFSRNVLSRRFGRNCFKHILNVWYTFILFSGNIETVKVISVYTALDRIGVNRRLRNDTSTSEEIGIVANNGDIMETYLDFAAHRGDIEIFKHIYNLSTKGRWPRKTRKSIKSFKLLKNSKGRTPDYFANGAFKQEILKFIQKNR